MVDKRKSNTNGRKPNKYKSEKFQCYLSELTMRDLEWLIDEDYGPNVGEVGAYFIRKGLDELKRVGFIEKKTKKKKDNKTSV